MRYDYVGSEKNTGRKSARHPIRPKDDHSDYIYGEYKKGKEISQQESRGGVGFGVVAVVLLLLFLLLVSACFNMYAYERLSYYEERAALDAQWLEYYEQSIAFIDEYVAFVEDNGSNYFHAYSCEEFGDEAFWAFNTDGAIEYGYLPCPRCH